MWNIGRQVENEWPMCVQLLQKKNWRNVEKKNRECTRIARATMTEEELEECRNKKTECTRIAHVFYLKKQVMQTIMKCIRYLFVWYVIIVQVTQPVGYVGTLPAIRINESTAEWTARDCYV
jgi:phosphopantetheinyl transferase (holo-ACP synthase)